MKKVKIISILLLLLAFALLGCKPTEPAKQLQTIEITAPPEKTQYTVGEQFDPKGMVVMATYSDGSKSAVTDYTYSPAGELTAQDTTITITYQGKTATVDITVSPAITLTGIQVTTPPDKIDYIEGETFNPAGMVVVATYSDQNTAVITNYTFTPDGPLNADVTQIIITYQGKTATVNITVAGPQPTGIPLSSVEEFNQIYDNLDGEFYLTNDIDFGGASIAPIGDNFDTDGTGFSGIFDGRGYALKNMTFQSDEAFGNTLFRRLEDGGVIKNLAVTGATATGRAVGLLVGNNLGRIENCYLEGTIDNTNWDWGHWCYGGSIFGRSFGTGIIRNVVTKATAQNGGSLTFGGVLDGGTMENCFAVIDGLNHGDPVNEHVKLSNNQSASIPGNVTFRMSDISSVDFSALPARYWNVTPGQLPTLKHLD